MISRIPSRRFAPMVALSATLLTLIPGALYAQGRGGAPAAPLTPKANAPEDLTGYWVSVVTEDWRFRMVTPAKGDYASLPLNAEGRKVADTWDPAKDEASGNACKSYGAAAIMRVPGRVHITWPDENTLKVDLDAGTQTRVFHFNGQPAADEKPSLQGYSVATWEGPAPARGARGPMRAGSLKVVTTHLKAGYLRKNGVPYSDKAVVTEYYTRTAEPNGDSWLIVTTIVDDPTYLQQPFITSTHFKHQADEKGWAPSACEAK